MFFLETTGAAVVPHSRTTGDGSLMHWTNDVERRVVHTPPPPPPPPPLPPPALSPSPRGLPRLPNTKMSSVTIGQRNSSLEESIRDPVSFAEKRGAVVLHDLRNMGLARAMRALDALRKHTPTNEEINELGASERLDTQDRAGLLILCGCKRGGRLTSNEMKTVNRVTLDMANVYDRLEALFHILIPRTTRNRKAPKEGRGSEEISRDLERFFDLASEWLGMYEEARKLALKKRAELSRPGTTDDRAEVDPAVITEDASHGDREDIEAGHSLSFPAWLSILVDLYQTAREECRVPLTQHDSSGKSSPPTEGKLFSAAAGNVYASDSWGVMTEKGFPSIRDSCVGHHEGHEPHEDRKRDGPFSQARQVRATGGNEGSSEPRREIARQSSRSVDSLASFSRFLALLVVSLRGEHYLSGCVVDWTTPREVAALEELVMASNDGSDQRGITLVANIPPNEESSIAAVACSGGSVRERSSIALQSSPEARSASETGASQPATHPVRYWALRIHRFLLSIRELKTVPHRDEDKLSGGISTRDTGVID